LAAVPEKLKWSNVRRRGALIIEDELMIVMAIQKIRRSPTPPIPCALQVW
jgi:hypothetical protein